MRPCRLLLAAALLAAPPYLPAGAEDVCDACFGGFAFAERAPLRIEVESGLQFAPMALRGKQDGGASLDPQTGRSIVDGNAIDLGGMSFQGKARIYGDPLRPVRVEMPGQVDLRSPAGGEAVLNDFVIDLPAVPMLDENGVLEFAYGARVASKGGEGGNFRGRIRITVEYF